MFQRRNLSNIFRILCFEQFRTFSILFVANMSTHLPIPSKYMIQMTDVSDDSDVCNMFCVLLHGLISIRYLHMLIEEYLL